MIARLKGVLEHKGSDGVIVDIGGVGYRVNVSLTSYNRLPAQGQEITLYIFTYVREDQITLFGFTTSEEKALFQRLITVSGVGPKSALAILSGMAPHDIVNAVIKEDIARLNSIPGIGRKTADRIIVDLKDKFLKDFAGTQSQTMSSAAGSLYNDALSALINLGYAKATIEKALSRIDFNAHTVVQTVLKQTLKELSSTAST